MVINKTRAEISDKCGSDQLCAGIRGGSEAGVHAILEEWHDLVDGNNQFREHEGGNNDDEQSDGEGGGEEVHPLDLNEVNNPPVIAQLDAENAFNRVSRSLALLLCRHTWPSASRFLLNGYRGDITLFLRGRKKADIILSREGSTQGDPAAGLMFAAATLPMIHELKVLTNISRREVEIAAERLERNERDEDANPEHTLYVVGGTHRGLSGDANALVGIGILITNNRGQPIFSAGQVTQSFCSQNKADKHALVFGLRVVIFWSGASMMRLRQ